METLQYRTGIVASTIVEFVGSFYFVFCSCVATTFWSSHTESSVVCTAVVFGLALAAVHCSSCELTNACANPVVALALCFTQRLDKFKCILFIVAHIIGGITGAGFHYIVTPKLNLGDEERFFEEHLQLIQGFVIEFLLSIFFVFALFTVVFAQSIECCDRRSNKSWQIGAIYALCVMVDFPYTSGSLNPIWQLGQGIFRKNWGKYEKANHWVYWAAPILGGILGAIVFEIWTSASDLSDTERCSHFRRMVSLLIVLLVVIIVTIVITVAV